MKHKDLKIILLATFIISILVYINLISSNILLADDLDENADDSNSSFEQGEYSDLYQSWLFEKGEIPDDSILIGGLEEIGKEISELIVKKETSGLLKYISPRWAISDYLDFDAGISFSDVNKYLNDTTSYLYCILFKSSCIKDDWRLNKRSVRDYLLEAQSEDLKIYVSIDHDTEYFQEELKYCVDGFIRYDWKSKPKDLSFIELTLKLVYTKDGWIIVSLFSAY